MYMTFRIIDIIMYDRKRPSCKKQNSCAVYTYIIYENPPGSHLLSPDYKNLKKCQHNPVAEHNL